MTNQEYLDLLTLPTSITHISTLRRAVPFISQRETYNVGLIT